MDDLRALKSALLLNRIKGLGPNRQQALLTQFSLTNIFEQDIAGFFKQAGMNVDTTIFWNL